MNLARHGIGFRRAAGSGSLDALPSPAAVPDDPQSPDLLRSGGQVPYRLIMTVRAHRFVVEPDEGLSMDLGYTRLRLLLTGDDTSGAFAVTEQPLDAGVLAGPLHTHANEDGFIYVVAGRIGAQVEREVVEVGAGGTVLVPRGTEHTFWNATGEPAVALEFFSPAGLEGWFRELGELVASVSPDIDAIVASASRYGTELNLESVPELLERHGLRLPGL